MEAGYKQITHGTYNMHKIINITLKAFAAVLMLAAAASCVFEKENPSGTGQQKYKYVLVQLGVSTDRMTPTKADGDVTGADDEAGSTAETDSAHTAASDSLPPSADSRWNANTTAAAARKPDTEKAVW